MSDKYVSWCYHGSEVYIYVFGLMMRKLHAVFNILSR